MAQKAEFKRVVFPFATIVGQDMMKKALLLNAINPQMGGVLIRGEKGTGKSTAVRALAELLPDISVVKGCPFNCIPTNISEMCPHCRTKVLAAQQETQKKLSVEKRRIRVVDLPLGTTEDRLLGSLDIETAIKEGKKSLEPGILADANRGILYVDEINLLDDHVVDILLDSATSGVNVVEREGISFAHPAHFILVGTMNPEEGELRPQLLDRIALHVPTEALHDVDARVQITLLRNRFEKDPEKFIKDYAKESDKLRRKIRKSQKLLSEISISERTMMLICRMCKELDVEGHRPDIMLAKTAMTLAAFYGKKEIGQKEIKEAAELVLPFRVRKNPLGEEEKTENIFDDIIDQISDEMDKESMTQDNQDTPELEDTQEAEEVEGKVHQVGKTVEIPRDINKRKRDRTLRSGSGKRMKTLATGKKGRYLKHRTPKEDTSDIAFDATVRASAVHQKQRKKNSKNSHAIIINKEDLKEKVRQSKVSTLIVLAVDASGSMGAMNRMEAAKGTVLSLLMDAYQFRDRVSMVAFKGKEGYVLLPPTSGVDLAKKMLTNLPTGGKTPLAAGIMKALSVIKNERRKDPAVVPMLVLLSDGRSNISIVEGADPMTEIEKLGHIAIEEGIHSVVIDSEVTKKQKFKGFTFEFAKDIAEFFQAKYFRLDKLNESAIGSVISNEKNNLLETASR
ncbi:magnesium chelatase subunit D family protein [Thermodesulfobacteriota bacterium]